MTWSKRKCLLLNSSFNPVVLNLEQLTTPTLPRFATNLSKDRKMLHTERAIIPLSDPEAKVTYYLVSLNTDIHLSELIGGKFE